MNKYMCLKYEKQDAIIKGKVFFEKYFELLLLWVIQCSGTDV